MNAPWYFELLAIEPTGDTRAIKRAYAIALKRLDQETQAEEFARLRRAYELALEWQNDEDTDDFEDAVDECPEPDCASPPEATGEHPVPGATPAAIDYAPLSRAAADAPSSAEEGPRPVTVAYAAPVERMEEAPDTQAAAPEAASDDSAGSPSGLASVEVVAGKVENVASVDRPALEPGPTVEEHFKTFIARVESNPHLAASLLDAALNGEAMIALSAREQFEQYLVDWIHGHFHPPFAGLFEAALTRFGWVEQQPLGSPGARASLGECVAQWCHWLREDEQWRGCVLEAVAQACSGRIDKAKRKQLLDGQKALQMACERYPQWMLLHLTPGQLDRWNACISEATRGDSEHYHAFGEIFWRGHRVPPACRFLLLGLVLIVTMFLIMRDDSPTSALDEAPAMSSPLVSFQPSADFCGARARLNGRWVQLFDNELNYRSFKSEVSDCLEAHLWPGGEAAAKDYLRRLEYAWRHAGAPDNVTLVGRESGLSPDELHRPWIVCSPESSIDMNNDPRGADCVALAATYHRERVPSFQASASFCADRAKNTDGWQFDKGSEWQDYLSFRQEVTDCLEKGWWPGGRESANAHLNRMIVYWRARYPQLIAPVAGSSAQRSVDDKAARAVLKRLEEARSTRDRLLGRADREHAGAKRGSSRGHAGTTLTVGSGGRLVIGEGGVQVSGDVRINGRPISADSDVPPVDP